MRIAESYTLRLLCSLVCGLFFDFRAQAQGATPDEALVAYESAVKAIESYDVRCTTNWVWQLKDIVVGKKTVDGRDAPIMETRQWEPGETPLRVVRQYRQVKRADGHRRIEEIDQQGKLIRAAVFDGEVFKQYSPPNGSALVSRQPSAFVQDADDYSTYIENASGHLSIRKAIPEARRNGTDI